ncbi:hypothetical protein F5Y11DRAFT_329014 [Daldinia sp. FL1419]|nr:hypothetical protein F5Y11DRAFT_329014 [Daldinia sp. FL1419]
MANFAEDITNWARKNPWKAAATGVAVVAPGLIAGPVLGVLGFGANGIVGGSIAAGIQSGIGNVAAGGVFATLQSAGMAGYGAATVNGIVSAGGIIGSAFSAYRSRKANRPRPNPFEDIWDSSTVTGDDDDSDDGNNKDYDGSDSKIMSETDIMDAGDYWHGVETETVISSMDMTPQLVERLKEIEQSKAKY